MLLLTILGTQTPLAGFSPLVYLYLVLLAVGPQLIGHSTFNWALKYLSASTVAVLTLGEPIGATLLAYLLLGETLTLLKGVGAALIQPVRISILSPCCGAKRHSLKHDQSIKWIRTGPEEVRRNHMPRCAKVVAQCRSYLRVDQGVPRHAWLSKGTTGLKRHTDNHCQRD